MRCVNNADALVFCPVLVQLWAQNDKLGDPVSRGMNDRITVEGTWYTRCLVYQVPGIRSAYLNCSSCSYVPTPPRDWKPSRSANIFLTVSGPSTPRTDVA